MWLQEWIPKIPLCKRKQVVCSNYDNHIRILLLLLLIIIIWEGRGGPIWPLDGYENLKKKKLLTNETSMGEKSIFAR